MTLNADLVRTRCQEIENSLARLDKINKSMSKEQFLNDRDAQDIASYRLLVAIEASLALCYHVAAKRLRKVPEEYAELLPNACRGRDHFKRSVPAIAEDRAFQKYACPYVLENRLWRRL